MNFGKNIKLLRKRKRLTQEDVANFLKIKRSTLSGYENGIAQPNIHSLIMFSDFYNVSIDTLIKIDLEKLSEKQLSEIEEGYDVYITGGKLRVLATTVNSENEENIELVSEKAKAGYTSGYADPEYLQELPVFQLPFLSKQRKYRTFQISGDSMLPIPDGAWITGEFVQDWNLIENNRAYIILTFDDGVVFKIVENKMQTNRSLMLYSLNPDYEAYELPVKQIREIWKFVNFISNELPEPKLPDNNLIGVITNLRQEMNQVKNHLKI